MHKRRAIREAIEAELNNITGLNVISARLYAIDSLPSCVIAQAEDSAEIFNLSRDLSGNHFDLLRTLTINLEVIVTASANVDDELDSLCESIEVQLGNNRKLGGLVRESVLTTTSFEFEGESEAPHGKAVLTYEYQYTTATNDPT